MALIKLWKNFKYKDLFLIGLIIFINIITRLSYILSDSFFINGDEAIFGVMVRNALEHGQWPLFFYGNSYLLVFFEVVVSGFISFLFGLNIFSLKMSMLFFWLASLIILYYFGKKIFTRRLPALVAVMLISFIPVWFDWATKASGGYLTALLISNAAILLTVYRKNIPRSLLLGVFLLIIYYAQPLWLVILLPFVVYYFLSDFRILPVISFAAVSGFGLFLSRYLMISTGQEYSLQSRLGIEQVFHNIKNIFHNYMTAHSGRFFDAVSLEISWFGLLNSSIFVVMLVVAVLWSSYLLFKGKIRKQNAIFFSSIILYVVFMLFYNEKEYSHRYLLPIFIPGVFLIVLTAESITKKSVKNIVYGCLVVSTIFSLFVSTLSYVHVFPKQNDGYTELDRVRELKGFLLDNDVKCVYALDWIISQHIYYFIPDVVSRYQEADTRRPDDAVLVDVISRSKNCALVGLWYHLPTLASLYNLENIYIINNRYTLILNPQQEQLLRLGFELSD